MTDKDDALPIYATLYEINGRVLRDGNPRMNADAVPVVRADKAADRIAALTAERDKLRELANGGIHSERAALIRATKAEAERDALRLLERAVLDNDTTALAKAFDQLRELRIDAALREKK